jgi:dTDP-4-dehydrorhamnose reductase
MRVLILGGDGMLGHQLLKLLSQTHETKVTLRQPLRQYEAYGLFNCSNSFPDVDVRLFERLMELLTSFSPHALVNCVGLVKQRDGAQDVIANVEINTLLPQRLAILSRLIHARLIHISTDCVFSGRKGMYTEDDVPDPADLYGRTKLMGEVSGTSCLTLRTSIIGRELSRKQGLLEWFLSQEGTIKGYKRAIFSGLTTAEFSNVIKMVLDTFPQAHGIYHVSANPIDKFTLLGLLRDKYRKRIKIELDERIVIDRSLDSSRFRVEFRYIPPSWPDMVANL